MDEDDWIEEAAAAVRLETLPAKSKKLYYKTYDQFIQWKNSKKLSKINEDVLLVYFNELAGKYAPTSLWSKWSMLRSVIENKHDIDIKRFGSLKGLLKRKNQGYQKKKAKVFTEDEISKFLNEAPDRHYLAHKMVMVLGISAACRREEMYKLEISDFKETENAIIGKIRDAKFESSRTFVIEPPFLEIYKAYAQLRVPGTGRTKFLMRFQGGRCHDQVIGKEKIGKMPREIAEYLKLQDPHKYTGHSFRRTSTTIFSDAGASIFELQQLGGWKSEAVTKSYVNESIGNKRRINRVLQNQIANPRSARQAPANIAASRQLPTATITRPPSPPLIADCNTEAQPPPPPPPPATTNFTPPPTIVFPAPHRQTSMTTASAIEIFSHHEVTSEIHQEVQVPLHGKLPPIQMNNCNNCNVHFNFPKI